MNNFRKAITKLHSKSTTPTLTQRLMFAVKGMPSHTEETALKAPATSRVTCLWRDRWIKPLVVRCDHQTIGETCTESSKPPAHYALFGLSSRRHSMSLRKSLFAFGLAGLLTVPAWADTGLEFPRNDQVPDGQTVRFKFTNPHQSGLPIYGSGGAGVTYIFKIRPKQQTGYYTTFFWGNDDGTGENSTFTWDRGGANTYYGMHPYPPGSSSGTTHNWEVSVEANDYQNGRVIMDAWYTQVVRVWSDGSGKHHEFYWDWPNTDAAHKVTRTSPTSWGNATPPFPALTFGDAPWQPGREMCSCALRNIQIYAGLLSLPDIQSEINSPQSTAAGIASIWYKNINPTPTDISDKSGSGHNPVWVGSNRPTLYENGGGDTTPPAAPANLQVQ